MRAFNQLVFDGQVSGLAAVSTKDEVADLLGKVACVVCGFAACTQAPSGPACQPASYEGQAIDARQLDYGPVVLSVDDRGRASGRIDGVMKLDGPFLGEVTWNDVDIDCSTQRFNTSSAVAIDCDNDHVKVRAEFTDGGGLAGTCRVDVCRGRQRPRRAQQCGGRLRGLRRRVTLCQSSSTRCAGWHVRCTSLLRGLLAFSR